jgi:hypothetical protein
VGFVVVVFLLLGFFCVCEWMCVFVFEEKKGENVEDLSSHSLPCFVVLVCLVHLLLFTVLLL